MSKKRYVSTRFWDDTYISCLEPCEKLLFMYLLTSPLTGISGAFEISTRRMAYDTGLSEEQVKSTLEKFQFDEKVFYFYGWIIIKNFIKNQVKNPKVEAGIERELQEIPERVKECIKAYDSLSHFTLLNLTLLNSTLPNASQEPIEKKSSTAPVVFTSVALHFDDEIRGKYAKSMLDKFADHWDQEVTHHKQTIALWQKKKITGAFDVKKRLATWKRKDDEWNFEKAQRSAPRPSEEPVRRSREGTDTGFSSIGSMFSKKI